MRTILLIVCCFFFGISLAQHPGGGECTLQPDNKAWLWKFKEAADKADKIELIVSKITSDTEYFEENPSIENLDDRSTFGTIPCATSCTIRFVLIYGKGKGIPLDIQKNPELEELILEFNGDNIQKIELNEHHERDIYKVGAAKRSGLILYTEDKMLKKKVRKVLKAMAKS